jgi:uncharacterized protein
MPSTTTTKKPTPATERTVRPGFISHTELASSDPPATRKWCEKVLGWKFGDAMPMPDGSDYHMWSFAGSDTGGGIRKTNPGEPAGSVPYCEVPDIKAAEASAKKAGAKTMLPPMEVPGAGGWICVVQAPGGPAIGFWAPSGK